MINHPFPFFVILRNDVGEEEEGGTDIIARPLRAKIIDIQPDDVERKEE